MKVRVARLGAAVLGCAAVMVSCAAVASADPPDPQPDPHRPDLTQNYCPGGQWNTGFGTGYYVEVCDGEKYPDGSYWHQWKHDPSSNGYIRTWATPDWHYDCVGDSGNNAFPAAPPPGGCDGAIPPAPAAPPGT
ncbi:hypothetical protein E2F47_09995 [Mycobacterium eburneum]|nr:hypothetical protein E2F47_09995 [Mycobacterium eburneum]